MKRAAEPIEIDRPAILSAMAEARGHIGEALVGLFGRPYGISVSERRRQNTDRRRFNRVVLDLDLGVELRKLYPRLRAWSKSGRIKGRIVK